MSEGVIYKIINEINGKKYIGSTINKSRRWRDHKRMLKNNCHDNQHLQNAWNKYGSNSFRFSVIEKIQDVDNLLGREDFYIKYINYYNPESLYNIAKDAKASMRGREMSEKTRKKMSESHKGKELSEETKEKLSKLMSGNNNYNYGKKIPEKTREKMSKALKGREMSEKTRKKMSESHKGKELSEKHKKNLSEASKGENHPQSKLTRKKVKVILYLLDGDSFTHKEIGKMYGVSKSAISSIARGKNWTHVSIPQ